MNEALTAETVMMKGHDGDKVEAYLARPADTDSFGGVVVIHHLPGYDSATKEITRKFAARGYAALMPNLYHRDSPGASPDDAAAAARAKGGMPDDQVVGDVAGAAAYLRGLPGSNG
jgi:carboxymethylenebutenolidase